MKFVRLKPYNGRTNVKKTHTVFGIKFQVEKGWYKVDDDVAEYLKDVPQKDHGPDAEFSAKAFDIVDTLEEAKEMDEREQTKAVRNVPERAERKIRSHTPGAGLGKTAPTTVTSNLVPTRGGVPSPVKKDSRTGNVPKWAAVDRIEGVTIGDDFDSQPGEFDEDMAAKPKKKKHLATPVGDLTSENLEASDDTEGEEGEHEEGEEGEGAPGEDGLLPTPKRKKKRSA